MVMVYLTFQPFQPLRGAIFGAHVLAWKHPPNQESTRRANNQRKSNGKGGSEIFEVVVEPTHLKKY